MTRKEEIYQKAEELYQDVYPSSMAQRHGMEGIDRSNERNIFVQAAIWADKTILEKACDYLWKHCNRYILTARDIEEFKQKMEE